MRSAPRLVAAIGAALLGAALMSGCGTTGAENAALLDKSLPRSHARLQIHREGIVVAMRTGGIAAVAPFRYSASLWAIAAGFVVWRELPDLRTWTGIAVVTGRRRLHHPA